MFVFLPSSFALFPHFLFPFFLRFLNSLRRVRLPVPIYSDRFPSFFFFFYTSSSLFRLCFSVYSLSYLFIYFMYFFFLRLIFLCFFLLFFVFLNPLFHVFLVNSDSFFFFYLFHLLFIHLFGSAVKLLPLYYLLLYHMLFFSHFVDLVNIFFHFPFFLTFLPFSFIFYIFLTPLFCIYLDFQVCPLNGQFFPPLFYFPVLYLLFFLHL